VASVQQSSTAGAGLYILQVTWLSPTGLSSTAFTSVRVVSHMLVVSRHQVTTTMPLKGNVSSSA
jgi:hypothetical protein